MESSTTKRSKLLPANAYTKLKPGEAYHPIVSPEDGRAEVTRWSVVMGLTMVVVWSAACIYMALKAGSGIEAAVPIAVLAIFFGKARKKKSTILENVMVQSIGQASGVVAAGAAFVIPALYINQIHVAWWHIFLACSVGGILGVVLIIPLRRYFVEQLHGELPFPEATAVNEIIVSGEKAGKSAGRVLLASISIGAAFDFLVETVHAWNPLMTTGKLLGGLGTKMDAMRMELKMNGTAALFGLGYIIGLRYAAIIAAGSILAYVVMVPLIYYVAQHAPAITMAGESYVIGQMGAGAIFKTFVRPIGIGAIAMSGLIGIIRMGKIIVGSVSLGFKGIAHKSGATTQEVRTRRDMHPKTVLLVQGGAALLMGLLFFVVAAFEYSLGQAAVYAAVGMLVGFVLSFLFTPVAAQAIAIVGTNPVSGMTLITIVISAILMSSIGLVGKSGMFVALVIGTAVCTALSTSGALISDFKIGYWVGSTPRNQQIWKFAGIILASLVVAGVIPAMDAAYHFTVADASGTMVSNPALPAPQANMLAEIAKLVFGGQQQPFLLYVLGAVIALLLFFANVPQLAFALGMYLPIEINLAVLAGGFCAWIIGRTGKTETVKAARREQGSLIASGLLGGGALIGVVSAVLRLREVGAPITFLSVGERFFEEFVKIGETTTTLISSSPEAWYAGTTGQMMGLIAFIGLGVACYFIARKGARWEMEEAATNEEDSAPRAVNS